MSNLLKYVENLFQEKRSPTPVNRNTAQLNPKSPINPRNSSNSNALIFPSSSSIQKNQYTNSNNINNNTNNTNNNLTNQGYINPNNPQSSSNALDLFRKRKEIKENLSEESQIKIFGENPNFNLDLKVFGRSIFQNLILTATATSKSNYTTNGSLSDNNLMLIPVKCIWKRFKNETEISISNINTNSYIPTAEDIGYTILVEAQPVDRSLYGELPLYAQYGPIEMDLNVKNTLELLLTSGGTKFSCFFYDSVEQEKKTDKELILHINSNELRLCEVDYTGTEKDLERCKLHHFNPQILLNTKDTQRFLLRFFNFEAGGKKNFSRKKNSERNLNNNKNKNDNENNNRIQKQNGGFAEDEEAFEFEAKFTQEVRIEYDLIAMSKQCRELIYLLIQIFLIDEKIKNCKLFACANYNLLPQDTKIGVTDLITEIKTLREENVVLVNNVMYYENLNSNLRKEMKELEEEFQISLETINNSMRINSVSDSRSNSKNSASNLNNFYGSNNNNANFICSKCSNYNNNNNSKNSITIGSGITSTNSNSNNNTSSNYNNNDIPKPNNNSNSNNNKINLRSSSSNKISSEAGNYLDLKIKYDELKEINLNLVSKEKALREENQDLLLKLEISKNAISDLTADNKKLKETLNQANSDLQSVNKNSQILLEQKNKLQQKSQALEKERELLANKNSELSLKIDEILTAENSESKNQSELNEKKIEELNKKNETLNYEIKNLIIQRNLLTSQKDNLTKEFEKLKNERAKFDSKESHLQQEIENLKDIIKEKEKVFLTLNNDVESTKKHSKEIKEKYELLEIEHNALKDNYDKNFLNFNFNNNNENNNKKDNLLLEGYDENSVVYNNNDKNYYNNDDSVRFGNFPDSARNNYSDNKLHKITSEEFEEFEILRREKEESDALIMQLKSNSEAKDLEIASLKKLIDSLRGKK